MDKYRVIILINSKDGNILSCSIPDWDINKNITIDERILPFLLEGEYFMGYCCLSALTIEDLQLGDFCLPQNKQNYPWEADEN